MNIARKTIAVVQGADSATIQQLLAGFAAGWRQRARIVGVIEESLGEDCGCTPGQLRNLSDGRSFPIFQDLGPGSQGCALDAAALVSAGEAVRRDIIAGCDLVVLSKFGKFEAENGSGLMPALVAGIEAGVPVITSVAPKFMGAWERFASPWFDVIPATSPAIEVWWTGVRE
jgi:hypothetical protein